MANTPRRLSSPAALQRAGGEELGSLAALLDTAKPGESVHSARRRIKRLRSLLRLIRAPLGDDAFHRLNGSLRQAAVSLAGSRQVEALLTAARRLEPASAKPAYWRPLAEAHRQAHEAGSAPLTGLTAARASIAAAMQDLAQLSLTDDDDGTASLALVATYGKARKRLRRALASGAATELHEARKFVIHHLHHRSILALGTKKQAARLEALRQALGDLNDLDELAQLCKTSPTRPPARAMARLQKARGRLLEEVTAQAGRLFRHGPRAYGRRIGLDPGT